MDKKINILTSLVCFLLGFSFLHLIPVDKELSKVTNMNSNLVEKVESIQNEQIKTLELVESYSKEIDELGKEIKELESQLPK